MDFGVSEMLNELKTLRKGYGVESADIAARVGVALRAVCGVTDDDSPELMRRKVSTALTLLINELPVELRPLGQIALALGGTAPDRYQTIVEHLATRLRRDPRTALRRIDEVLRRVAQLALDQGAQGSPVREIPWHTVRLQASVMLDLPVIEVIETRRIVAHQPNLTEIESSVTVTPPPNWNGSLDPADIGLDVVRGGVLNFPRLLAPNRYGFSISAAAPARPGRRARIRIADQGGAFVRAAFRVHAAIPVPTIRIGGPVRARSRSAADLAAGQRVSARAAGSVAGARGRQGEHRGRGPRRIHPSRAASILRIGLEAAAR
jgi:hypothetical protein